MTAQREAWKWIVVTAAVLALDTASTLQMDWPLAWHALYWRHESGFEISTFFLWFVLPLTLSAPTLDWGYFSLSRLRRIDWALLAGLASVGVLATLLVPHFESLREIYLSRSMLDPERKWAYISHQVAWVASWLIGWEFLHRYALLRAVDRAWPRYGWLWVPASEFVFHLQKPMLEAFGMLAFSLVATRWAVRRKSLWLPLVAHLAIELGLALQLAFF